MLELTDEELQRLRQFTKETRYTGSVSLEELRVILRKVLPPEPKVAALFKPKGVPDEDTLRGCSTSTVLPIFNFEDK